MKKQTTGLWYYEQGEILVDYGDYAYTIAEIPSRRYVDAEGQIVANADGRLMAAAPELADALLFAVGLLDAYGLEHCTLAAKAALKKAGVLP